MNSLKKYYKIALIGGSLISIVPAMIVSFLSSMFPSITPEGLDVANNILEVESYGLLQYFFIFLIIIVSPIIEELIFRGAGWWAVEKLFNKKAAFFLTTFLFCAVHGDILQIVGLIPISLFFGWLRYKTGSIKPGIVAHVANNCVGCILMVI